VVLDTTRADAISAYGVVEDTSPTVDRLAAEGLRYRNAFAHSPWTLPSHVTMFTGLLPNQHGTHAINPSVSRELVTLAEHFEQAGYETIAFTENPWVYGRAQQGFGEQTFIDHTKAAEDSKNDLLHHVEKWLSARETEANEAKPFFLFLNIMNAHAPLPVRDSNRRLPTGVSLEAAKVLDQQLEQLCASRAWTEEFAETYRALYHDGVVSADRKLAQVLARLEQAGLSESLITIVTSDHGEAFGAHQLLHHFFSLYQDVLHIPLVVHGLQGVEPGVLSAPVGLMDLAPSILAWAGLPVPDGLPGQRLPENETDAQSERALIAEFYDPRDRPAPINTALRHIVGLAGAKCRAGQLEPGGIRSIVRFPYKLVRVGDGATKLFDLSDDPAESQDLAAVSPELLRSLTEELDLVPTDEGGNAQASGASLSEETLERLRVLGYTGD
jgi:arylsulfatase A-like enzyme